MEDNQILFLLWERAESALDALAEKFGRRLYQMAMNILGNPPDAEEAVSDTYFALWNAIPPERLDPLAGYVYRVCRNTALNRLRTSTAQKRDSRYDQSLDELAGCLSGPALEDQVDARELGRAIDRFLDTVSRQSRVIFLRRHWFGDSVKEIAASLDMTESAVSVRLHRTRNQLRTYLVKEGYLYEEKNRKSHE